MSSGRLTNEFSYQLLVEGIDDVAIYMLEIDGTIASWNRGAQRLKGYRAQEIIGQHFRRLYTEADVAKGIPAQTLAIARSTGTYEGEGWRVRNDGTRFWANVVVDAVRSDSGELLGFAKITRDVTERSIKEEQRQVIVDAAPNGMLIVDTLGTITLANAQAERIFGYAAGAIAGRSIEQLMTGGSIDRFASRSAPPVLTRTVTAPDAHEELTGKHCDGSSFPVEVAFNATATARGRVFVASVADVTERHAVERRRRASEAALEAANRLMVMGEEMAHYGHWRLDLASKSVYWSDEIFRTFGLGPAYRPTLEGDLALFDPGAVDVAAIIRRASLDGEPYTFESRILRPDRTLRDVRCSGRGERDAEGKLIGLVGIFQDVTERKDAQRERDRLVERVTLATQAGSVGIWEWRPVADTMEWDAPMFALYGLDQSAAVASYALWDSTLHEYDRERVRREVDDSLSTFKPLDTEFRVVWPNAEVHTIRARATVLRDAAGKAARMIGINWDISEVRSLADQLYEEKERQRTYERDRLYEHERKWSTTFQRAVLPSSLPRVAGCTFDAVYDPGLGDAQVGGDWYDAVRLIDGRILVSIGDVAGSGLEAAVVVGVVRQIMRGIAQLHASPMLILDAADRALCLEYPGVYVSAWVGLIDLVTHTITYASAGHPQPLVVAADGRVHELEDSTTMLIGLREGHRGHATTVALAQNDTLVLYTDGVTEASRDVIAGHVLVREAASTLAGRAYRHPAEIIKQHVIPNGSLDDVAILVVRMDYVEAEAYIERWQFNVRDGNAAGATRRSFIGSLERRGFAREDSANAELVFGELIGNVARHAGNAVDIDIALDHSGQHAVLHIFDRGGGFHHISRLPPDPYAENGRGLFLIAALTIDFTVAERRDGGSHARAVLRGGLLRKRFVSERLPSAARR